MDKPEDNIFWDDLIKEGYQLKDKQYDDLDELEEKARSIIQNYYYIIQIHLFSLYQYINIFDILHFWTIYQENINFFSELIFSNNEEKKKNIIKLGNENWKDILFNPITNDSDQRCLFQIFINFISSLFSQSYFQFKPYLKETNILVSYISKKTILRNSPYVLSLLYSKCNFLLSYHEKIPELTEKFAINVNSLKKGIKKLFESPNKQTQLIDEAILGIEKEFWFTSTYLYTEIDPKAIINFKEIQSFIQKLKEVDYNRYTTFYLEPFMNYVSDYFKGKYKFSFNTDFVKSSFNQDQFKKELLPEYDICYDYFLKNSSTSMKSKISKNFLSFFSKNLSEYFDQSIDIFNEKHIEILSSFLKYVKDSYSIRKTFKSKISLYFSNLDNSKKDFSMIKKISNFFFKEEEETYFYSSIHIFFSQKESWIQTFEKSKEIVSQLFSKEKFEAAFICWIENQEKSIDYQPQSELFLDAFKCFLLRNEKDIDIQFIEFLLDKMSPFLSLETNNEIYFIQNRIERIKTFDSLTKIKPLFEYFKEDQKYIEIDKNKIETICDKLSVFIKDKKISAFKQLFEEANKIFSESGVSRLEVAYALNSMSDNRKLRIQFNPRLYCAIDDSIEE